MVFKSQKSNHLILNCLKVKQFWFYDSNLKKKSRLRTDKKSLKNIDIGSEGLFDFQVWTTYMKLKSYDEKIYLCLIYFSQT